MWFTLSQTSPSSSLILSMNSSGMLPTKRTFKTRRWSIPAGTSGKLFQPLIIKLYNCGMAPLSIIRWAKRAGSINLKDFSCGKLPQSSASLAHRRVQFSKWDPPNWATAEAPSSSHRSTKTSVTASYICFEMGRPNLPLIAWEGGWRVVF